LTGSSSQSEFPSQQQQQQQENKAIENETKPVPFAMASSIPSRSQMNMPLVSSSTPPTSGGQPHVPTQYANVASVNASMVETPKPYSQVPINPHQTRPTSDTSSSGSSEKSTQSRQYGVFPRNSKGELMKQDELDELEEQQNQPELNTSTNTRPPQQQYQQVPSDLRAFVEPSLQPKNQYASVITRKD
jgi:hypothetical protein